MRIVPAALACAVLVALAGPARAAAPPAPVIAPGQEQLVGRLLAKDGAPGGCRLGDAAIQRDHIVASYACGDARVPIELHAPQSSRPATLRTERFVIVAPAAPAALRDDLEKSVRAHESAWVWSQPVDADGGAPGPASGGRTPEEEAEYQRGLDLYRAKKYAEAYEIYVALARKANKPGVLGMVVASLASTHPSRERVAELTAAADRAPDDVVAQFTAGVAAHYYAHQSAPSKEAKRPYYEIALKYLARANPAYAAEPRLWIYLAVSNFRLGHQDEAEQLIEKAVALGADDPDAYYCRAEIFQQKNLQRSLADLDVYLEQMKKNEASARISAPEKNARVERMKAYLLAVSRGERKPVDLFDPVAEGASAGTRIPWWTAIASLCGLAALLVGLRSVRSPTS